MAKLVWDQDGQRFYETGISNGALFVMRDAAVATEAGANKDYKNGVAWSGLTSVSESPTGGEAEAIYADNMKYLSLIGNEELEGSIECYTYPAEFKACNGEVTVASAMAIAQQKRKKFGLAYITKHSNDKNEDYHKLHFVYGCYASPSERSYATVNDSPEAITFSYDFKADPVKKTVNSIEYTTALITISEKDIQAISGGTPKTAAEIWEALKDSVFGDATHASNFLYPDEIYTILTTGTAKHPTADDNE